MSYADFVLKSEASKREQGRRLGTSRVEERIARCRPAAQAFLIEHLGPQAENLQLGKVEMWHRNFYSGAGATVHYCGYAVLTPSGAPTGIMVEVSDGYSSSLQEPVGLRFYRKRWYGLTSSISTIKVAKKIDEIIQEASS